MPAAKRYRRKRPYRRRRIARRGRNRNRLAVARIPRPLQLKSRSATQRLVYYNTFLCDPKVNSSLAQQNYSFRIFLNSPWIFPYNWDLLAKTANNQVLVPNTAIFPAAVDGAIEAGTTAMPGFKDGFNLAAQYAKGCVVGTKISIQATPLQNETDNQPGILYAVKHSQPSSGLGLTSNINDLQKLPFRQQKRIMGSAAPTSGFSVNNVVSSKIVVKHSPKRFNNVKDLRDNNKLFFQTKGGANSVGSSPDEGDYLSIGILPQLVDYQVGGAASPRQTTKCSLSIRVEQSILWTEPLENLSEGTGNYSFPRGAFSGYGNMALQGAAALAIGYM
jgi:hypothetical protein